MVVVSPNPASNRFVVVLGNKKQFPFEFSIYVENVLGGYIHVFI